GEAEIDQLRSTKRRDRPFDVDLVVVERNIETRDKARLIHDTEADRVRDFGLDVRVAGRRTAVVDRLVAIERIAHRERRGHTRRVQIDQSGRTSITRTRSTETQVVDRRITQAD